MEPPSAYEDSSSSDVEIENQQDNTVVVEKNEPKLDIRTFLEVGEYIDYFVMQEGRKKEWITLQITQLMPKSLECQTTKEPFITAWIEFDFLLMRKQWVPGIQIRETYRMEYKNQVKGWLPVIIREASQNHIKIHYCGYKNRWDEIVELPSDLIAPLGTHTSESGIGRILNQQPEASNRLYNRFHVYLQEANHYAKVQLLERLEQDFPVRLNNLGYQIKIMGGDGNCMFRAISDQLYGTEDFHRELRHFAMQYILTEREFFQNFVIGGNVDQYVEYKSKESVWGDNIELQAFRELYQIPIEVYVYDTVCIKTGLETNPYNKEPIRISYHGNSHYNSIKPVGQSNRALLAQTECGIFEQLRMASIIQSREQDNQQDSQEQFINRSLTKHLLDKPNLLEDVFNESKKMFEEEIKKKEREVIQESKQFQEDEVAQEQLMDMQMKEIEEQQVQDQQLEVQILEGVLAESKKQQLEQQELQLQNMLEQTELEKVLKESQQSHEQLLYQDPLNNPVVAQVMSMGSFSVETVLEAFTVVGSDPEMILNYIYENYY